MLNLTRSEVRPFEPRHGRIAQVFAEQAAIAISNARLFNDLDESLARQRAMTEILDAVSTARFDLQPVFDRIAEHASRLCDSSAGVVALRHGDKVQFASGKSSGAWPYMWERSELDDTSLSGATILSGKAITVDDWDNRPADQFPASPVPRTTGIEVACLPMLRDGVAVGSIARDPTDARRLHRRRGFPLADLRQPGGHRRRERAAAARDRAAQRRAGRVARAADRDRRDPRAHQRQPRRPAQGVRRHRRPGGSSVRCRRGRHHRAGG